MTKTSKQQSFMPLTSKDIPKTLHLSVTIHIQMLHTTLKSKGLGLEQIKDVHRYSPSFFYPFKNYFVSERKSCHLSSLLHLQACIEKEQL